MSLLNKNWNSLIKPSKVVYDGNEVNKATIVIEPLERGFGYTVGNALRRVLLSSLQGAAITAVAIDGVDHEFSTKPGIKQDIVDIILNLKNVCLKIHSSERKIVKVKAKGPCVVTAGMIQLDSSLEIMNPDQEICTLSKDTDFEMDVYCEVGKGYTPSHLYKSNKDLPIGMIAIDALFSPIKKVSYKVEDTRVGQVTDFDKLIMDVETDYTVTPDMAIALSARILQDQFKSLVGFEDEQEEKTEKKTKLQYDPVLLKKVSELELSVRSCNCLQNDNIVYIGDLVTKTEAEMLRTQNFGRKSLNEIKDVLSKFNLKFGMDVNGWPPENIENIAKKYEESY